MTGPEHYREAQRLLAASDDMAGEWSAAQQRVCVEHAQVHATLALVAAVANLEIPSANILTSLADAPSGWANGRGDSLTWRGVLK